VRVLLDEQLPVDLAVTLQGHSVDSVVDRGWAGITNGELLQRMQGEYDALITMDRGIEFSRISRDCRSACCCFVPRPIG